MNQAGEGSLGTYHLNRKGWMIGIGFALEGCYYTCSALSPRSGEPLCTFGTRYTTLCRLSGNPRSFLGLNIAESQLRLGNLLWFHGQLDNHIDQHLALQGR